MAIVEVRIDDRLIHGQVCGYWVPHHSVEKIVVIDDKLKRNLDKGSRVMLLAAGPEPLLKMVEDGYRIEQITVGNLSGKPGYQHVKKTLYLSDADV